MDIKKHTILFILVYKGEEYRVQTYKNQYHSLMTLISDRLGIPGFGLCSGMGSCGTCLTGISLNEGFQKMTLSCGVRIDDELANTIIYIPPATY